MGREGWPLWRVGFILGAIVGLPVASFGTPALQVAVAMVALAYLAARSLALLSGALTGIGGVWLALLIRAQLACDAFDVRPSQGCESHGVEPWLVLSVIVLGLGLLLGVLAWRRGPRTASSDAPISR
jgi:hypothetical protein